MSLYPTPTTKGFGHASEGQTMIFRKESREWRDDRSRGSSNDGRSDAKTTKNENLELSDTTCERLEGRIIQSTWKESRDKSLPREVLKNNYHGGKLNVNFTEFLMGYPQELDKDENNIDWLRGMQYVPNAMYLGLALRRRIQIMAHLKISLRKTISY